MALKQVILNHRITEQRTKLSALQTAREVLRTNRTALEKREKELETAVVEVTVETSAEDKAALEAETAQFEKDEAEQTKAEAENKEAIEVVEHLIAELTAELEKLNAAAEDPEPAEPEAQTEEEEQPDEPTTEARSRRRNNMQKRAFYGMNMQQRAAFFKREDVKGFLTRVRDLGHQKRSVKGAELTIPTVVLDLLRENIEENSKLIKHIRLRKVRGNARQTIAGAIPEAVWTEMTAKINELNIEFGSVEMDGYKVAGFIPVSNAILEDSDINLFNELITMLGQALGMTLDKAILYGTGKKMPLGIVVRLEQESQPEDYPVNGRKWENLKTTNIVTITGKTGTALYQEMLKAAGAAKGAKYGDDVFWAMNRKTHLKLKAEALGFNANGALVSGMEETMPVIGGMVEELDFIPDDVIIGGYGACYTLVEREGATVDASSDVLYLEDQTVFRAKARYDGQPVIPEGFVAIGIGGKAPTAVGVEFVKDTANEAGGVGA